MGGEHDNCQWEECRAASDENIIRRVFRWWWRRENQAGEPIRNAYESLVDILNGLRRTWLQNDKGWFVVTPPACMCSPTEVTEKSPHRKPLQCADAQTRTHAGAHVLCRKTKLTLSKAAHTPQLSRRRATAGAAFLAAISCVSMHDTPLSIAFT